MLTTRTVKQLDEILSFIYTRNSRLKYLCGMHLNDSKTEHNSQKDRHENIGLWG